MPATAAPLRFGLIGASRIAPVALIRPARRLPHLACVQTVAARGAARATAYARRFEVPGSSGTYDDVLRDPNVDAVYISLPNGLHAQWSCLALTAGKHVLCEKPMAANAVEAERVAEAGAQSGVLFAEAFHTLHHPLIQRIRDIVAGGRLGELRRVEATFHTRRPPADDIRFRADLAGGATMDLGCYAVRLARLVGDGEPVVDRAVAVLAGEDVDLAMDADLVWPATGMTGRISCGFTARAWPSDRLRLVGSEGELRVFNPILPHLGHAWTLRTRRGTERHWGRGPSTYRCQLEAFVGAVRARTSLPLVDAAEGVRTMRVIDAIYTRAGLRPRSM